MAQGTRVPEVEIIETEKIELAEPTIILGFTGPGLIGCIAVGYLIEQLEMKEVAHVRSRYLPSAVVFIDGRLRSPFRIYSDKGGKLCAVVCEIPLYSTGAYPIASALLDWAEEKGAKELIVLEGVPVEDVPKERRVYCAAEPEKIEEYEAKGVEILSAGIIQGIAGSILSECLTRKITGVAFLAPTLAYTPDPEGAVTLIEALNNVHSLGIKTEELSNSIKEIKQKLSEIAQNRQRMIRSEESRGSPEAQLFA
jgi:uncharacterized protein